MNIGNHATHLSIVLIALATMITPSHALLINFSRLTENDPSGRSGVIGANQVFAEMDDLGYNTVGFAIYNYPLDFNVSNDPCFISQIFFDMGNSNLFESIYGLYESSYPGSNNFVDFSLGGDPANLPGSNLADPPFHANTSFTVSAENPASENGINLGEHLNIVMILNDGKTFDDAVQSMLDNVFRIGMHVQGFTSAGNVSESFISGVVPEPATIGLMLAGLGALATTKRRRTA